MKKWLLRILSLLAFIFLIAFIYGYLQLKDNHSGYWLDLNHTSETPAALKAGFSALPITPEVPDTWEDANKDGQYHPEKGDTYQDVNGNGKFDAVWMAGFQNRRPARGIHDDLWARAMVLDDGKFRLAWVVLDAIGYGNDDILTIRKSISESAKVDYVIIASTHTHEGPDLIGMWGESEYKTGVDQVYRAKVIEQSIKAVETAVANLRPAKIRFAQDLEGAKYLVTDSRKPIVTDHGLRLMQAIDSETNATLGTLIAWANHPETLWNENLLISSDFPHYVREAIEKGILLGDSLAVEGLGGVAIYANGSIGGLMTTLPEFGIKDLFSDTVYTTPSYPKTKTQGEQLALLAMNALRDSMNVEEVAQSALQVSAKSIAIPLDNPLYKLGALLGIFERGLCGWWKMRSEVAYWQIGPAGFLHHPSEIYPEIVNGGIEAPAGQDFNIAPQELPAVRSIMPDRFQFVMGLSNDMVGYAIPKSEWDEKPPYTYDFEEAPYGEINSCGPETAPILHRALRGLLEQRKK